ncbi:MAG TPA: NAD(P)-dependent oxidoreductase [Solirubrobacteraceae bacterium]|nr:NAD(P)-dependent oxidoreductase [Solirubrobacteraceae bacterium]
MGGLLILGAGYIGAAVAARALDDGLEVTLADNWWLTDREQVAVLERRGARVVTADIRFPHDVDALLAEGHDRIVLLAAQASRPVAFEDPEYTEQTNCTGVRHVAESVGSAGGPPVVFGSSLHVYGGGLSGTVGADLPYGEQGDLAHLSKVYGELVLKMHARRGGVPLSLMRLGIVYGPSPVEHDRPESVTVVDTFRRRAQAGEPLTLDDGGRATIGVVHVDDVARILLGAEAGAFNVAAETITVADVAALAEGREPTGGAAWAVDSPFAYERSVAEYLRR